LPDDGWEVLYRGQDAGRLTNPRRTLALRGGDRYRVLEHEPYDDDLGLDAAPGTTGELVAISVKRRLGALKTTDGAVCVADLSDLTPAAGAA
jgi:hypothetical protein